MRAVEGYTASTYKPASIFKRNHHKEYRNQGSCRAIAYEIIMETLWRKLESRAGDWLDIRKETANFGNWIPAFAGMTLLKSFICDSPDVRG